MNIRLYHYATLSGFLSYSQEKEIFHHHQLCYPKANFRIEIAKSHPSNFHQVSSFKEVVAASYN